jgi:hypothetical protein
MSDKIKKFDGGGVIWEAPIAYASSSGGGTTLSPLDLNTIQQSYASTFPMDLDFMDMLEEAADRADPDLVAEFQEKKAFEDAEKALIKAAGDLANWKSLKGSAYSPEETEEGQAGYAYFDEAAKRQNDLEEARANFIALGGDPDSPNIGQKIIDFIGATGQTFSDIITLGTGPEVAQTLLDPVSILLGGLGGTINYAESGKTTPVILGQTSSGMPVGLNIPDPRAIGEGGLTTLIPGAAAVATTAGALSLGDDKDKDPTSGVGPTAAGVLTAAAADDDGAVKTTDQVTVDPNAGDPIGPVLVAASDQLPPVDRVSLPGAEVPVDRVSLPEAQVPVDRVSLPEAQVAVERTSLPEAVIADILASERTDPTRTALPEPTRTSAEVAAAGGGGGGGGGTTAPSGGIRTVSGGPGPSVDIDYLYDFARGLEQPFQATEEEEEDIVRVAEGGMIGGTDDFERILRILRGM